MHCNRITEKVDERIKATEQKVDKNRIWVKDKKDWKTVDQVLDPWTLIILEKWIKNLTLSNIYGCISTGKDANVYHAYRWKLEATEYLTDPSYKEFAHPKISTIKGGTVYGTPDAIHFAIKVFKTSILIFKDRERYVEGEFRFRRGTHQKSNPRQMVK